MVPARPGPRLRGRASARRARRPASLLPRPRRQLPSPSLLAQPPHPEAIPRAARVDAPRLRRRAAHGGCRAPAGGHGHESVAGRRGRGLSPEGLRFAAQESHGQVAAGGASRRGRPGARVPERAAGGHAASRRPPERAARGAEPALHVVHHADRGGAGGDGQPGAAHAVLLRREPGVVRELQGRQADDPRGAHGPYRGRLRRVDRQAGPARHGPRRQRRLPRLEGRARQAGPEEGLRDRLLREAAAVRLPDRPPRVGVRPPPGHAPLRGRRADAAGGVGGRRRSER
jgi:hypothetical protein